jgi:hypothetical protein
MSGSDDEEPGLRAFKWRLFWMFLITAVFFAGFVWWIVRTIKA